MGTNEQRCIAVLFLMPEDRAAQKALHAETSRTTATRDLSIIGGSVLRKQLTTDEVHEVIADLVANSIANGASLWIPNPEENWCQSNREALTLALALSEVLSIPLHFGPGLEPADSHPILRRTSRTLFSMVRALQTVRAIALDAADQSLMAGCIRECSVEALRGSEPTYTNLDLEVALLRGIGMSDFDIVKFFNTIIEVSHGSPIDRRHLPASGNSPGGHFPLTSE